MPSLRGFSDNSLETREDVIRATLALLRPLIPHFSAGKARIRVPVVSTAHFDESAAQLEGFARPLWAVGALLASAAADLKGTNLAEEIHRVADPWVSGLAAGTDPRHPEYWGTIGHNDQRMVEAEIVSFALLSAPDHLFHNQDDRTRQNITSWLQGMNGKAMPENNWRWFRVFANLALVRVCGVPFADLKSAMDTDLILLSSFYRKEGWSADGHWLTAEQMSEADARFEKTRRWDILRPSRQADYYSGSFAIQFSQLMFIKYSGGLFPTRLESYREQAREFGRSFWRYFDSEEVPNMPPPLQAPGAIKGHLLRHMRWWAAHSDGIFYPDGTLNIGWRYPNMYMAEDYNSPQSPYWCMKSLVVVALGQGSDFWSSQEQPYPSLFRPTLVPAPGQIISNHPAANHHFMLSLAQFVAWPLKASQAKYSKFEYSSAFAFSVPTGTFIQQIAPDNTLALSRDGGETWAVKWKCSDATFSTDKVTLRTRSSGQPSISPLLSGTVLWKPWGDGQVEVETTLIPPTDRWPDWHIRIHRVRVRKGQLRSLHTVEGGFAIQAPARDATDGQNFPMLHDLSAETRLGETEGLLQGGPDNYSALILSAAGASGVSSASWDGTSIPSRRPSSETVYALQPDSNTNLASPKTLIPVVVRDFASDLSAVGEELLFVTSVFAVSTEANDRREVGGEDAGRRGLDERWADKPQVVVLAGPARLGELEHRSDGDCIVVSHDTLGDSGHVIS